MAHWGSGVVIGSCLALLLVSMPARGDIPTPEQSACSGKQVGDDCEVTESDGAMDGEEYDGECQDSTCSRYAPSPDGGADYVDYACVLCEDTGGCSIRPGRDPSSSAWLSLGLSLAWLASRRRRRGRHLGR